MKILYVTTSFDQRESSAAIRNNGLVKGLFQIGHSVDVLTVEWPTSMRSSFLISENKANIIRTSLPELKLLSFTHKKEKSYGWISKVRHFIRDLVYFPDGCYRWPSYLNDFDATSYDIIISSSDNKSSHYAALKLIENNPSKLWIQIWGDPWLLDIHLRKWYKKRVAKAESSLLKKADGVIYVSDPTRKSMVDLYPKLKDKFYYVPRSYFKEVYHLPSQNCVKESYKILYPGVLSVGRNVQNLLNAIKLYNEISKKTITLDLYGRYSTENIKILEKYDFVNIFDSVEYKEILDLMSHYDIGLLISNGAISTQIPGKLFDFLGSQLPVLCIVPTLGTPIFKTLESFSHCYITEDNKQNILTTLKQITNDYQLKIINKDYSPESIANRCMEVVDKLLINKN